MRQDVPLMLAEPLPPLPAGIEILVSEARLPLQPTGMEEAGGHMLTVLLSFDPTEAERRAARALAASFIAAACSFEQAPSAVDVGTWLADTLHHLPASSVCLVIALPDHSAETERWLCEFLDCARRTGHHDVELAVAVASNPSDWSACSFDGFVSAEPIQREPDALRMFEILAGLMAPGYLCAIDSYDLQGCLGTALQPARLLDAIWLRESRTLVWGSPADQNDIRSSTAVASIVKPPADLKTLAGVSNAVRAMTRPDVHFIQIATSGLTAEPRALPSFAALQFLYRPEFP